MRFYLLTLVTIGLFLSSCGSKLETVEVFNEQGELVESYQINPGSGEKHGKYQRYIDDYLREESTYQHDTLHGIRKMFWPNGTPEIEEHYVKGTFEGPFRTYYENGQLKLEGLYEQGTMEGEWVKYYESGQVMEQVTMHLNEENGPFTEYHKNGNLKAEGTYLEGDNEHGTLLLYDETGTLERKMQCDHGICHTTWQRTENTVE